jgi:hypothetical protein
VIYAHASDRPNRFADVAPIMAEGVREDVEYVYLESGERKSVRFDLGTSEGLDCVDIQHIALPGTAASYLFGNGVPDWQRMKEDIRPRLGPQPGVRVYLVYVEIENRYAGGIADGVDDDSPDGVAHRAGDRFALVFDPAGYDIDVHYFAQNAAHELFHVFGAVQESAPHGDDLGHCSDGSDLMCTTTSVACVPKYSRPTTVLILPLDCNGDDYFNPSPEPGSYLASHWNTYNSPFLCEVGTCAPDNVGPKTVVKGPDRTRDRTPRFKLRADEAGSTFECKLDRGKRRRCASPFETPKLDPGQHKLAVTATDPVGNADPSPDVHRFRITG